MGFRNIPFGAIVREGWEKAFDLAKLLCLLHVTGTYLVSPVVTYGPSMLPSIDMNPSLFLAERLSTRSGQVSRGDVVTLRSPQVPRKIIAKRVVALEGDTVTFTSTPDNPETLVVPKGYVWVQGDNAYDSIDSRKFGPVPFGLIQNRLFWRVWPIKDFGAFGNR